jgi:hypothetical protein
MSIYDCLYSARHHSIYEQDASMVCKLTYEMVLIHVRCVPCHHSMAHPQVADRGDSLQIWRIAANISSHGQLTRCVPPVWGFGVGITPPHCKK